MKKIITKKGFSLIELVVAMGIFLVVITLAIGAFVAISRMKALTSTMKDVQQSTRIANEMITRLSRQANKVVVKDSGKILELYTATSTLGTYYGYKFIISGTPGQLSYYECPAASVSGTTGELSCSWSAAGKTLLGNPISIDTSNSLFAKTGEIPPNLEVKLNGKITTIDNNPYYSDNFVLDTKVILEGIK